jgi:hypothetical protein
MTGRERLLREGQMGDGGRHTETDRGCHTAITRRLSHVDCHTAVTRTILDCSTDRVLTTATK